MTIRQHIPNFVNGVEPAAVKFSTWDELMNIWFVRNWWTAAPEFHQFSLHWGPTGPLLMAELKGGQEWWVVGMLSEPLKPFIEGLPKWEPQRRTNDT